MKNSRWMLYRVGLVNFWYYDEEEFHFSDGRMLLRGSNGSGKSVTMQSFIPLLLDGNMRPERLDSFGSRARKMDNYLLEEDDEREERIGYLYMELKRADTEQYVTFGIGLRARKYKKLESWYFCITDGRRLGKDFFLYRDLKEKIPFTKTELRNRISEGGKVMDSQGEYMEQVNKILFGFETIEEYKEMLELLLQLRTPKLSKDFKPSIINDILSSSLQTLSEDDLRPLSEAIENMDAMKANMDQLRIEIKAASSIERTFSHYNRRILYDKAKGYLQRKKELESVDKQTNEKEKRIQKLEQEKAEASDRYESLVRENDALEEERRSLENNDAFQLKQEEQRLTEEKERLEKVIENKQNKRQSKEELRRDLEGQKKKQEEQNEIHQEKIEEILSEIEEAITDISFDSGKFLVQEIREAKGKEISFLVYEKEYQDYLRQVEDGIQILQKERTAAEKYDERLLELEECREKRSAVEREVKQYENLLQEAKGELLEEFYRWNSQNESLKLSEETMQALVGNIDGFYFGKDYSVVKELVRSQALERKEKIIKEIREIKDELLPIEREQETLAREKKEWEQKKDPEPERDEKTIKNREKLKELGIEFYPLYETLDFSEKLTNEQKGRLEEALAQMGILDAIIVPMQEKERLFSLAEEDGYCDKYLFGETDHIRENLLQMLEIENQRDDIMFYQAVSSVLSGMGIKEGNQTFVEENGRFQLGVLSGNVSGRYQPKFIGKTARERYRLEKIHELEEKLADVQREIHTLTQKVTEREQEIIRIEEEEKNIPKESTLVSVARELADVEHRLEIMKEEVLRRETILQETRTALEKIREQVQEICRKAYLPIRLDVFERAKEHLSEYGRLFRNVDREYDRYRNGISTVQRYLTQLDDVAGDLDDIIYEQVQTENQKKKTEERISAVLKQLQMSDYHEIKERLEHCIHRLSMLPKLRDESIEQRTGLEKDIHQLKKELEDLKENMVLCQRRKEQMGIVFQKEVALGYVPVETGELSSEKLAEKIVRELEVQLLSQNANELSGRVQGVFHENKGYLSKYQIMIQNIFTEIKENMDAVNEQITRLDIRAKYRGTSISFPELLEKLKADMEIQERLLSDKDKELFEDILAGIISKKIRAKIHASKRWVKKMNQLMESMQTSSGLCLSLKWKSKKAEKEEQLDTGSLVELLEQDVEIMQESDVEKLSKHFRSKIAEARQRSDGEETKSFHAIMREILDYREWFEFCLECQKIGEKKKEMTDRVFFTFSGGEKAMSMYVPLFSAVVAKYSGAREDAPRLIALDEAFAGVDEMNIKDMFRLMVELEFNFIMNSQILWGDYETVPALAIYQLVRPQNAKYVSVIAYTWNGKNREFVTEFP